MKKRLLAGLLAAAMTLTMAPAAFAAEADDVAVQSNISSSITDTEDPTVTYVAQVDEENFASLSDAINKVEDGGVVNIINNVTEDVVIPKDKAVTLNLNGQTITNSQGHTITNNGKLAINGTGTIDNVTNRKATVYNAAGATCNLNGEIVYSRSAEASTSASSGGGNSYYVIDNVGTMNIRKGTFKFSDTNNGAFSSLIHNGWYDGSKNTSKQDAVMTIWDGDFTQGTGGKITVKNDDYGVLDIQGGVFTQPESNYYCVFNYNKATISGGTINGHVGNQYADDTSDKGHLDICGDAVITGDVDNITAKDVKSDAENNLVEISGNVKISGAINSSNPDNVSISGGTFSSDVTAYCAEGLTALKNEDGTYTIGKLPENLEDNKDKIEEDTAKGTNTSSVGTNIKAEDEEAAKDIAQKVDTTEAVSDSKPISDTEKVDAIAALKNIGAITVDTEGKIEGDTEVSIIKETYLDVTVKDFVVTGDSNVYTISMDITPKYNLIATTDKDNQTENNSVTFSTGNTATVAAKTEITITLPKEFAGKLVYINHNDKNLYTATADENGKITFVTDGFSPFTFTLTKPSIFNTSSGGSSGGGSSSSSSTSTVSASKANNGTVSLDKTSASKGSTVTITVKPDKGYKLDKLTVTDSKGNTITVTNKGNNKYTFTMPDGKVTVTPTFVAEQTSTEQPSDTKSFSDVKSADWFASAVDYVVDKGMMNGVGNNKFAPNDSTTRGMLMTVIARYAGQDTTGSNPWYQKGMEWAKSAGVSDGTAPNANITREQLVTMLYRYAKSAGKDVSIGEDTNILSYTDATTVSEYAIPAMQWACGAGIVNGSNGKLLPKNNATRAEVAAILMRFCENVK